MNKIKNYTNINKIDEYLDKISKVFEINFFFNLRRNCISTIITKQ